MENITRFNKYEDAVSYILSIPRFSGKSTIEETKSFGEYLMTRVSEVTGSINIHIAGTNGKGSVCAYLTALNRNLAKSVGTFTSPHLSDIRERICLNGEMISKEDFLDAANFIIEALEEYKASGEDILDAPDSADIVAATGNATELPADPTRANPNVRPDYHPSFFEFMFFMARIYFANSRPDVIIWETGLGGRLDATNTLPVKDVTVITEIGLDHMEYLGNTKEKIASEKAGILMEGVPVVYARRDEGTAEVIEKCAGELNCPIYPIIAPIFERIEGSVRLFNKGIAFSYESRYYNNVTFEIGTQAVYQVENACVALKVMELISDRSELTPGIMQKGLLDMKWPGRMEEVEPGVYLDGAHNVDGIISFVKSVAGDGCRGKRLLLFSAVMDKQVEEMAQIINDSGLFSMVASAHIDNSRGLAAESLKKILNIFPDLFIGDSIYEAYRELLDAKTDEDILYVCGSLYLIGELKDAIRNGVAND